MNMWYIVWLRFLEREMQDNKIFTVDVIIKNFRGILEKMVSFKKSRRRWEKVKWMEKDNKITKV